MKPEKLLHLCEELGVLKQLQNRGYIVRKDSEVIFTDKVESLSEPQKEKLKAAIKSVSDWIEEYRSIFPKGISVVNYPARGDKRACIKKMQEFLKAYPEYDKELILKATQNYVNRKYIDGYKYLQTAHYFIFKDKISNLAAECEYLLDSEQTGSDANPFEDSM